MQYLLICLIKIYQIYFRGIFPRSCRFHPSCSEYYLEAVQRYGVFIGSWMGIKRILRCNPFSAGGYDPVALRKEI
ncbi:MAG: membrane protein insertion efficiency factor YidD [Candidatus Omnitrophica bacterium]|nr:membrane protein insertion efficiency factor YidD [Candidatus Omnitrophota bacterium]